VGGGSVPLHWAEEQLQDPNQPTPLELLIRSSLHHDVAQWLQRLPAREARILRLRYGLLGREPLSCEEVGKHCRLSGERVRQIEREALRRLRRFL
jgi:RNA polymerase sigma factor (sigma-70 family)